MKKKNTTEMVFDSIEELVEMGIQVGLILESDRIAITAYLRMIYKNGYYLDATDIRCRDGEICVPLTLKALPGLLKQRGKEIEMARTKYKKSLMPEVTYDTEKLDFLISEAVKIFNFDRIDIVEAIKKRDFASLYRQNEDIQHLLPLLKFCVINGQKEWYTASATSINKAVSDLTKHAPEWAKKLKNEIK